jgi:hypothetical protein
VICMQSGSILRKLRHYPSQHVLLMGRYGGDTVALRDDLRIEILDRRRKGLTLNDGAPIFRRPITQPQLFCIIIFSRWRPAECRWAGLPGWTFCLHGNCGRNYCFNTEIAHLCPYMVSNLQLIVRHCDTF